MKRLFFTGFFICSLFTAGFAQDSEYKSAIGGRLSSGYYDLISGSYKTFISDQGALEFNLGFRGDSYESYDWVTATFSAAYQHHFDIKPVPGLKWFIGGGLAIYNSFSGDPNYRGFGMGIFPTGGIDYKFGNIPLNLTADCRPTISLVDPYKDSNYHGHESFDGSNFGISVRYTLR
ncbi:hypothetical protein [Flavihumibacter profundi]|uniref:hypothetical protein n=1 Tax=Flavihumibacter profundi TaxID=2716883 RepID=UPI001CC33933|nr:hypothetical protein [Flavihumibacter profundi]MBZ5855943.1 hypothetical protein [Flavihumibacter profundi]